MDLTFYMFETEFYLEILSFPPLTNLCNTVHRIKHLS